jgi:hypothetical protein
LSLKFWCAFQISFFLLSSLSHPLFTYHNDEKGERENKKKVMGANQNSDNDTSVP